MVIEASDTPAHAVPAPSIKSAHGAELNFSGLAIDDRRTALPGRAFLYYTIKGKFEGDPPYKDHELHVWEADDPRSL
jgi:hypothetical protein